MQKNLAKGDISREEYKEFLRDIGYDLQSFEEINSKIRLQDAKKEVTEAINEILEKLNEKETDELLWEIRCHIDKMFDAEEINEILEKQKKMAVCAV